MHQKWVYMNTRYIRKIYSSVSFFHYLAASIPTLCHFLSPWTSYITVTQQFPHPRLPRLPVFPSISAPRPPYTRLSSSPPDKSYAHHFNLHTHRGDKCVRACVINELAGVRTCHQTVSMRNPSIPEEHTEKNQKQIFGEAKNNTNPRRGRQPDGIILTFIPSLNS